MALMLTCPMDLEILIHACVCGAEFPRRGAPAVEDTIRSFKEDGVITLGPEPNMIHATELGKMWLAACLRTPAPRQVWVDANGASLGAVSVPPASPPPVRHGDFCPGTDGVLVWDCIRQRYVNKQDLTPFR